MKIVCPKCRTEIPAGGVNAEKDTAFCANCGEAFRLSDLLSGVPPNQENETPQIPPAAEINNEELLRNPPPGTWINTEGFNTYIGASTRSPLAFFLVPFACVWSGGALFGIYGKQIQTGNFNPLFSLLGLPFLAGSVLLIGLALMTIAGKIEICLGRSSYIFKGIGPAGRRQFFNWDAVTRVYAARIRGRKVPRALVGPVPESGEPLGYEELPSESAIFLDGASPLKIGGRLLNGKKRTFILTALSYFYREKHKTQTSF